MNPLRAAARRARAVARRAASRFGGLPTASGAVDAPPPEVACDVRRLWLRNSRPFGAPAVVDPDTPVVVSFTTHGPRMRDAWLVAESIARGTTRPGRLILWLDRGVRPTRRLRRLRRRGLELRWADPELRSYKKYWPYLAQGQPTAPLVIADDDVVYPPGWLDGLLRAHRAHPHDVIAYRAHSIAMDMDGRLLPYRQWSSCDDDTASFAHFATGVSGVLYPLALLSALRDEGERFRQQAPTADDVWLHRTAVLYGHRTRQVLPGQQHPPFIPGSQSGGLNVVNVVGGGNDRQLMASHTPCTLRRIREDLARG